LGKEKERLSRQNCMQKAGAGAGDKENRRLLFFLAQEMLAATQTQNHFKKLHMIYLFI
jgi:hypothetical protein